MQNVFKVFWYDVEIKNLIGRKCKGTVLSIHKDYINILLKQNKIVTIVKDIISNFPQAPYRFVINKKNFLNKDFNDIIKLTDKVFLTNNKVEIGNLNKIVFLLPSKVTEYSLLEDVVSCFKISVVVLLRVLEYIDFYKPEISKKVLSLADNFLHNLSIKNKEELVMIVKKYIGLGSGSTPEFDDFLCGVLTSFYVFDKIKSLSKKNKEVYNLIKLAILSSVHKTTLLSSNFILQICEEKFSLRIIMLIKNLLKKEEKSLKKVVDLILSEGKNSGWWFLYGFLQTSLKGIS